MRWPLQPLQPFQQTKLQPSFGQSVDSLCHPWFTTTNVSYRCPILKLPPPPCAVLLVHFVTGKSSGMLSDILSGILSGIPSGILSGISSGILSGISSGNLSGRWGPAGHTELGRSQVEVPRCTLSWEGPKLRSSGAHWAGKVPGWGPAVHTELGRPQVEVKRCALSWEAPRLRSSCAHWAGKLAKSLAKSWQGGSWGGSWCRHGQGETGGGGEEEERRGGGRGCRGGGGHQLR